jgi:hypothetical protein
MKTIKKSISAILRYLFFFLFIGYYISITMFFHAHLVNGHIITHSHPFKSYPNNKPPFQSHSHSSTAYNLIYHLNKTNWIDAPALIQIPDPIVVTVAYSVGSISPDLYSNKYSHPQLRAPPTVYFL